MAVRRTALKGYSTTALLPRGRLGKKQAPASFAVDGQISWPSATLKMVAWLAFASTPFWQVRARWLRSFVSPAQEHPWGPGLANSVFQERQRPAPFFWLSPVL